MLHINYHMHLKINSSFPLALEQFIIWILQMQYRRSKEFTTRASQLSRVHNYCGEQAWD